MGDGQTHSFSWNVQECMEMWGNVRTCARIHGKLQECTKYDGLCKNARNKTPIGAPNDENLINFQGDG